MKKIKFKWIADEDAFDGEWFDCKVKGLVLSVSYWQGVFVPMIFKKGKLICEFTYQSTLKDAKLICQQEIIHFLNKT